MTSSVIQVPATSVPAHQITGTPQPKGGRKPRFTVIMPRDQHRFIKQLALDMGSDASTITRSLFTILQTDPALVRRLRQQLAEDGGTTW